MNLYSVRFLSVLHQNKPLNFFHKLQRSLIVEFIKGLNYDLLRLASRQNDTLEVITHLAKEKFEKLEKFGQDLKKWR